MDLVTACVTNLRSLQDKAFFGRLHTAAERCGNAVNSAGLF